jgi:hypothetical protein
VSHPGSGTLHTAVRVRAGSKRVVPRGGDLRRVGGQHAYGREIGAASAAGHRVTWIEDGEEYLGLEDDRTLRWVGDRQGAEYFDLKHVACPARSRFTPVLSAGAVMLTRAVYGGGPAGGSDLGTVVLRGCDTATGHDRVLAEIDRGADPTGEILPLGISGPWALLELSTLT